MMKSKNGKNLKKMLKELIQYKQYDGKRHFKYFVHFTEEYWPNQPEDLILGRFEVHTDEKQYNVEEIRVRTFDKHKFYAFNEKWGWKHYNIIGLFFFRLWIRYKFYTIRGRKGFE